MAIYYRTKGFVFKKDDRSEADRVFSVFTEDFGKIEIRGRAIRKITSKLRGGIDKFYFSEVEFIQGKNHKTLTDAILIEKADCSYNFEKLVIYNKIAEILDKFIKGQEKDEKLWNLISDTFQKANSQKLTADATQLLYLYFMWNFFSELGYMPETKMCVKCCEKLNPYNLYFSNKEGGIVCKNCTAEDRNEENYSENCREINSDIVKILRLIFKKDWQVLSRLKMEQLSRNLLNQLSENYYLHMLSSHSFS